MSDHVHQQKIGLIERQGRVRDEFQQYAEGSGCRKSLELGQATSGKVIGEEHAAPCYGHGKAFSFTRVQLAEKLVCKGAFTGCRFGDFEPGPVSDGNQTKVYTSLELQKKALEWWGD